MPLAFDSNSIICRTLAGTGLARLILLLALVSPSALAGQTSAPVPADNQHGAVTSGSAGDHTMAEARQQVAHLKKPLYNPFIERYVLDNLQQLRTKLQSLRAEMIEKITNKQLSVADKSMSYATDTVTYFFYLIAGATSLLVVVGWNSLRDMRQQIRNLAEQKVSNLVVEYEARLRDIEEAIQQKSDIINRNQEEIERTNEIHSLWLKASQETSQQNKIALYDQILDLRPDDTEALTYKADAVLELGEPLWAISLCQRALKLDTENGHAYYQLACAYAETGRWDDAVHYLQQAIAVSNAYRQDAAEDNSFKRLREFERFREVVFPEDTGDTQPPDPPQ